MSFGSQQNHIQCVPQMLLSLIATEKIPRRNESKSQKNYNDEKQLNKTVLNNNNKDTKEKCIICKKSNGKYVTNCGCYICKKDHKTIFETKTNIADKEKNNCPKCPKCQIEITSAENAKDKLNTCEICFEVKDKLVIFHDNCVLRVCVECREKCIKQSNKCPNCRKEVNGPKVVKK